MAAGGFREFLAGETLDEDAINDFLMQGVLVFAGTAARGSAIPSPVEGQFSFRTDDDVTEFYDGSNWVELAASPITFDFLVIAGGASGGVRDGGGGGAGGYRCSVSGENTGGGLAAENPVALLPGDYTVRVGAGGASVGAIQGGGRQGNDSLFGPIISFGGGLGAQTQNAAIGGSGGGAGNQGNGGAGTTGQGFAGGNVTVTGSSAGGGGASAVGNNSVSASVAGAGGAGVSSSITGSSTPRGGGGGGGIPSGTAGAGGTGGGGAGSVGNATATSGTANTGGGGGGSGSGTPNGINGAGGSGVVIIKYPDTITLTIGAGLTSSTATAGGFKVTTFTAGFDTVTIP